MHREFHPTDIEHLRLHAFDATEVVDHHAEEHRSLYLLTAILGLLIGGDVLFDYLGWPRLRAPLFGVSLATIAAVLGGSRIVYGALEALLHGRIGADIALAQACIAALVLGQPFVAAEVVFIAMVGEVLEAVTFARAQREVQRLMDKAPRTARVVRDGEEVEIPAKDVVVGDRVIVRDGERIPVDGLVKHGRSTVDQSALTGEAIPVDRGPGDSVYSGTLNQFGRLEIDAERVGHDTTLGHVMKLVADARRRKAPIERTADKLARWFLPVVETVAGLTLLAGWLLGWSDVWSRAVAVLVVACPCSLVLATPAAVLSAMAWLARHGILIKGSVALERLAGCDTFVFDKTGTLTTGKHEVAAIVPLAEWDEAEILRLAASAESGSRHPLAHLVVSAAAERGLAGEAVADVRTLPGAGVEARLAGTDRRLLVGNRRLMDESGLAISPEAESALAEVDARGETPLILAADGKIVGLIAARDTLRREAHDVIHDLKHLKITEVALLTGDRPAAAARTAKRVHIKLVESELLPADKAKWIEDRQGSGRKVAMVGDGINDAPALARADVGIALAKVGSDLAAEAGDILILGEPLVNLPDLVKLSRAAVRIVRQNIAIFAFGLNATAMAAAALGVLDPVSAAILHQIGSLLVLLNAMRLVWFGDWRETPPGRVVVALRDGMRRFDELVDLDAWRGWIARRRGRLTTLAVAAGGVAYAVSGFTAIPTGEVGLLLRNGRYVGRLEPGLHLLLPEPFDRVRRINPERVDSIEIGFRRGSTATAIAEEESLIWTGDGKLVELGLAAQYRAGTGESAERAFAFGNGDPEGALRSIAESAARSVAGKHDLDSLLNRDRSRIEVETREEMQRRADRCGLGVTVVAVLIQDVRPPRPVVDAFRDATRAQSEKAAATVRAETYRLSRLKEAQVKAAGVLTKAESRRETLKERSAALAESFLGLLPAREGNATLNDHRLYWEAVAAALAGKSKIITDRSGGTGRRQLILPEGGLGRIPAAPLVGPPLPPDASR